MPVLMHALLRGVPKRWSKKGKIVITTDSLLFQVQMSEQNSLLCGELAACTCNLSKLSSTLSYTISELPPTFESMPPDPPRRGHTTHTPFLTHPPSSQLAPTPLHLN